MSSLHETLSKITKVKENIDLILSSQRLSLNKNRIGFKTNIIYSKGLNHKKMKHPDYKCINCMKLGNVEPVCFDKLIKVYK